MLLKKGDRATLNVATLDGKKGVGVISKDQDPNSKRVELKLDSDGTIVTCMRWEVSRTRRNQNEC